MKTTLVNKKQAVKKQKFSFKKFTKYLNKYKYLYLLLIPGLVLLFIFKYIPMYGVIIAFKDFSFAKGIMGSDWNDFRYFQLLLKSDDFYRVLFNSLYLGLLRVIVISPVPIILSLLLNEIRVSMYKRVVQTVIYFPHFISWVVMGGIIINFLSVRDGFINEIIKSLGMEPIHFMARKAFFRPIVILSSIWKEAGWGTIIYLAALSGVDPQLYEAAIVDGANRWQRMIYITLPSILTTIVVLLVLNIGRIMNNGFEQIYMLQNPLNLQVSEVFETYTYRVGLVSAEFSYGAAIGVFTSVVGLILIVTANRIARSLGQAGLY
jgi:putative aldouronate transport system permease protein